MRSRKSRAWAPLLWPALAMIAAGCAEGRPADTPIEERTKPYNKIDPVPDPLARARRAALKESEGEWVPASLGGRPAIRFSSASGPLLWIGCDGGRGLVLRYRTSLPPAPTLPVELAFGDVRRSLASNPLRREPGVMEAAIAYNDPIIVAMAKEPAVLLFRPGGSDQLRIPETPLLAPLVADCRVA